MLLEFALAATVPLTLHYDATEWTNAAYHVGCLAGHLPCSNPIDDSFWKDHQKWTADDQCEVNARVRVQDPSSM